MIWSLSETMRLIEHATRPMGIAFGAGNIHCWNLEAHFVLRDQNQILPWLEDDWLHTCRRTVRMSCDQVLDINGFRFRLSCLNNLENNSQFIQGSYSAEPLLVEILSFPSLMSRSNAFADDYNLTSSETAILRELGAGATPAEIATNRRSTLSTIRQHLKNIRRKTGIGRMPSLVRFAVDLFREQARN